MSPTHGCSHVTKTIHTTNRRLTKKKRRAHIHIHMHIQSVQFWAISNSYSKLLKFVKIVHSLDFFSFSFCVAVTAAAAAAVACESSS